jgi:hypothetical protein
VALTNFLLLVGFSIIKTREDIGASDPDLPPDIDSTRHVTAVSEELRKPA